jgi:hypothetical protein
MELFKCRDAVTRKCYLLTRESCKKLFSEIINEENLDGHSSSSCHNEVKMADKVDGIAQQTPQQHPQQYSQDKPQEEGEPQQLLQGQPQQHRQGEQQQQVQQNAMPLPLVIKEEEMEIIEVCEVELSIDIFQ